MLPTTLDLLNTRRSCRSFLDKPLEPAHREALIEVARNAPTSHNQQNASVILIESPERKQRLAELVGGQKHVAAAAVNLIFLCDLHRFARYAALSGQDYAPAERAFVTHTADAVIMAQSVAVGALALGLGWVYIGGLFRRFDETMAFLEIPEHVCPAVMLCVGYPDPAARTPPEPVRLPVEARVYQERYPAMDDAAIRAGYRPFDEQFERDIAPHPRRGEKARELGATNFMQYLIRSTDAPGGNPGELARQDDAVRRALRRTRLLRDAAGKA